MKLTFKFLDHRSVLVLAGQVGRNESRGSVNLRNLVRQHVPVVVVSAHPKVSARPPNDLHRRSIADQVLQLSARQIQQAGTLERLLVVFVEHVLVNCPEALQGCMFRWRCVS